MSHLAGWRGRVGLITRIVIAAAVVTWLLSKAGVHEVRSTLASARPGVLLLALAAVVMESATKAWNWSRILDSLGLAAAAARLPLAHAYLASAFMGSVLPSTASTDALRILLAQRALGGRPSTHAAAIVTQNALGWVAACAVGLLAVTALLLRNRAPTYTLFAAVLFSGVIVAGVGFYLLLKHYRGLLLVALRTVMRRRWLSLRRAIRRFADNLLIFERAHVRFGRLGIGAVLAAVFGALAFALAALAVGVHLPLAVWGIILPLVSLTGLVPMSISGFGGAQAVHVLLLAPFGVQVSEAFAISALYAALNFSFNMLFGGGAWILGSTGYQTRTLARDASRSHGETPP